MQAPLVVRFATDHSAAKSGIQDLTASIVANMVKVSSAMQSGIDANGGYAKTVSLLASNVGRDFGNVANAGLKAANDSNLSAVAVSAAVGKAAAETKTAGVVMTGAHAAVAAQASFTYTVIRNEVAATARLIASSPLVIGGIAGLAGAVAAFVFVKAAVGQANEQLDRYIKLGNESEAAGVKVEFWQRFVEGAKSAKVAVEDVEGALKNATKAVTPRFEDKDPIEKRLSDIFESGYTGDFQSKGLADYRSATTNDGRIRATITAMQEMKVLGIELAAMDIGERLFGPDFTAKVKAGQVSIDKIAESLDRKRDDLIKQEEVDRAQSFRDRIADAYKEIDDALHISIAMANSGRDILDVWGNIVELAAKAAVAFGNIGGKIDEVSKSSEDMMAKLSQSLGAGAINDWLYGKRTLYDKPIGPEMPPGYAPPKQDVPLPPRRPLSFFLDPGDAPPPKKGGGSPKSESFDAVETFINGLEKTAAAVKAETEAFGKSNAEKAAAINLAKLKETADQQGITVTEEQTEKVRAASAATAEYRDKLQDLEQAQAQAAETARYFGNALSSGFADAILEGKSLGNVLMDLEKQIARAALQAMFTGQGPLAGFLGMAPAASSGGNSVGGLAGFASSFFGSGNAAANAPLPGAQGPTMEAGGIGSIVSGLFRANGGPVRAGQAYTVGEIGQEIFVPGQDGMIVPAGGGGGAAGGAPVLNFIDQRPAGSGDLAPTTRRNADGSTDILIRQLDASLQARGQRGQGGLSSALNTPGTRRG